jgi:hypothetical protein
MIFREGDISFLEGGKKKKEEWGKGKEKMRSKRVK